MPNPSELGLPNPARYSPAGDDLVLDQVTSLTWQHLAEPQAHTREEAEALCAQRGSGFRLPTAIELISLVDFSRPAPTIDPSFDSPLAYFWSSTPLAADDSRAWLVYFGDGHASDGTTTAKDRVRCVKAAYSPAPSQRYAALEASVSDLETGLAWQEPLGAEPFSFAGAAAYCAGLGAGFRLPTMKELQTLVDRRQRGPSIDSRYFPRTPAVPFWTSSEFAPNPALAWTVDFELGRSVETSRDRELHARCVR
jgi:hypothetical protein